MENLLCDLGDVLSVLPAGEHVGERKRFQSCMNQVGFWRLLFILPCRDAKNIRGEQKKVKMAQTSLSKHIPLLQCIHTDGYFRDLTADLLWKSGQGVIFSHLTKF